MATMFTLVMLVSVPTSFVPAPPLRAAGSMNSVQLPVTVMSTASAAEVKAKVMRRPARVMAPIMRKAQAWKGFMRPISR
jgi:hypothetical protein